MKYTLIFFFFLLTACGGKLNRVDNAEMHALQEDRKVKRISETDFLERVSEIGESIKSELATSPLKECKDTLIRNGQRVELYDVAHIQPESLTKDKKGELLEAYKYAFDNGQEVGVTVQNLNDSLYAYGFKLEKTMSQRVDCPKDFALVILHKTRLVRTFKAKEGFHISK